MGTYSSGDAAATQDGAHRLGQTVPWQYWSGLRTPGLDLRHANSTPTQAVFSWSWRASLAKPRQRGSTVTEDESHPGTPKPDGRLRRSRVGNSSPSVGRAMNVPFATGLGGRQGAQAGSPDRADLGDQPSVLVLVVLETASGTHAHPLVVPAVGWVSDTRVIDLHGRAGGLDDLFQGVSLDSRTVN